MRATLFGLILAGCTASAPSAPTPAPTPTPTLSSRPAMAGCARSATVLVIDRSGSMSGRPIEMARTAARDALRAVGPGDCFGVIAFDSEPRRLLPLAPVTDRAAADATIATLDAGGGTEIFAALETAFDDLRGASAAPRRAVVLFTDGQSPTKGIHDLVDAMMRENVKVSTVGLGNGVDQDLLRSIAERSGGRAFQVDDPGRLPEVIVTETRRLTN